MIFVFLGIAIIIPIVIGYRQIDNRPSDDYKQGKPCLTFDQFIRFYEICLDKFHLCDDCIKVQTRTPNRWYENKERE